MAKPKIIELNKNLNSYAGEILEKVSKTQEKSQAQLQVAKKLQTELIGRIRENEMRRQLEKAAEEQARKAAEEKEAAEQQTKAAEAVKTEEAKPIPVEPEKKPEIREEKPVAEKKEKPAEAENTEKRKTETKYVRPQNQERQEKRSFGDRPAQQGQRERSADRDRNRNGQQSGYQNRGQRGGYAEAAFDKDSDEGERKNPHAKAHDNRSKSGTSTFVAPRDNGKNYDARKKHADDNSESKKRRTGIKDKGVFGGDEDDFPRGSKRVRKKDKTFQPAAPIEPIKIEKAFIVGDTVSVKLFAEKTGKPVAEIIKKLFLLGMMCTINSEIDYDTASLVADDFGITLEQRFEQTAEDVLIAEDKEDAESDLVKRPPVVTVMGHVDHGKTSLLDAIRKTRVTAGEAGGITQHIGAYTVKIKGNSITFLDTPGHEAFTAMRARGAQATDIAVLVVAADDGVMPQTVEAINHAKAAGVPIIVAINKIDKEGANPDRIKQELTEYNLICEEWGGDVVMVPISALRGDGISNLLEMILLVADMQELKANPNRMAKGIIIEARLDKGRGPVATVLIQNGTLKVSDTIVAGTSYGRVRAMLNDEGKPEKKAGPSQAVEVIGFSEVPNAGDIIYAVEQDKLSRQVAEERRDKIKAAKLKTASKVTLDELFNQIAEGQIQDLNLVVKADVQGSVEAVRQSLEKLSNDEVRVRVIHGAVGAISESDVLLTSAANAIIIGFNVRPDSTAAGAAEREKVDIRLYRIIYNAIEDIEKAMKGMLAPEYSEKQLGHAEVRQTFHVSNVGTIAGCYVQDGKMVRNAGVRLIRDGIVVYEGKLSSLKRFKDDAKEVASGYECGITLENYNDIKESDIIEAFEMVQIER